MLRCAIRARPRKMSSVEGLGSGPEGRIKRLQKLVTGLIRHERIETIYQHCDETRGYSERLIHLALRNGNKHPETMEMVDYWLMEKDLIPKLFEVLVPRYQKYRSAFTSIYKLPTQYPGDGREMGIIELKGNPWPDVLPKKREIRYFLPNLLLQEAKKDYSNLNLRNKPSPNYVNDMEKLREDLV